MADKPYLCIVGTAESTGRKVPQDDPLAVIWGTSGAFRWIINCAAWFEMHSDALNDRWYATDAPEFFTFLKGLKVPLFMTHKCERYPTSVPFPIEEAANYFGVRYFRSTFDYMLALAIIEMDRPGSQFRREVRLFGIDMHMGEEWDYQIPSASFYIGWAMSRGIRVVVPESSSLLQAGHVYGRDEGIETSSPADERVSELQTLSDTRLLESLNADRKKAFADGQLAEAKLWRKRGRF